MPVASAAADWRRASHISTRSTRAAAGSRGNGPHQPPDGAPTVRKIDFGYLGAGEVEEITLRDAHLAATYQSFIKAGMIPKAARYEAGKIFGKSETKVKNGIAE